MTPQIEERFGATPTESLEAYDHWAHGFHLLVTQRVSSREEIKAAEEHFRAAIEADSTFALAWVYLARVPERERHFAYRTASEALPASRAAVERALELEPNLAIAHAIHGMVLVREGQHEEAEAASLRALDLMPGSADMHREYARVLRRMGRSGEALEQAKRAMELDPLSVESHRTLVWSFWFNREFDATIAQARESLEAYPVEVHLHLVFGFAHVMNGEHERGIKALKDAWRLDPGDFQNTTGVAWGYAHAGDREEALKWLDRVTVEQKGRTLLEFAIVYQELGELDRAYEYLEELAREEPLNLLGLRTDPTADSLRADPRYEPLMGRAGLEP